MKPPDDAPVNPPLSPLDRDVADAFAALDRTVPKNALDDFSSRVMGRLGENETSPDAPQGPRGRGDDPLPAWPPQAPAGPAQAPAGPPQAAPHRSPARGANDGPSAPAQGERSAAEDSGLHEIKALADSAKRRVSKRDHSESDVGDSFLLAAAQGGLRAVALPDAKRGAKRGAQLSAAGKASSMEGGPGAGADARSSVPFWILGSVASLAAVAAVAVFVFDIGRHHADGAGVKGKPAAEGQQPPRAEPARAESSRAQPSRAEPSMTPAESASTAGTEAGTERTVSPSPVPAAASTSSSTPPPSPSPPPAQAEAASLGAVAADHKRAEPAAREPNHERRGAEAGRHGRRREAADRAREGRSPSQGDDGHVLAADERARGAAPSGAGTREPRSENPDSAAGVEGNEGKEAGGGSASLEDMLDEVAGRKPPPPPPPSTPDSGEEKKRKEEVRPEKKELDRRDVASALDEVRGAVARCQEVERYEGTVTVKFVVAPTGQVSSSVATGAHARTRTGSCVAGAVKQARFKVFDGAPVSFTLPFRLGRPP